MAQIQGVKGEAVVIYREPLTTRQRRASAGRQIPHQRGDAPLSAFPKGKQHGRFFAFRAYHS